MTDRDRLIELLNGSRKKYLNLLDFEKNLIYFICGAKNVPIFEKNTVYPLAQWYLLEYS